MNTCARATHLNKREKNFVTRYASFLVHSIVTGQLDYRTRNFHVVFFLCVIEILMRSWLSERGI